MNNTMVREIRGAKINHPLKIRVRKIRGAGNYSSKYGKWVFSHATGQANWRAGLELDKPGARPAAGLPV